MWEGEPVTLHPSDGEVLAVPGWWDIVVSRSAAEAWLERQLVSCREKWQDDCVFLPTTCKPLAYCINESEMCNSCSFGSLEYETHCHLSDVLENLC